MSTSLRAFKGITLFSLLPLVAACTEATSYPEKLERPVQVQRVTFQSEDASREFVGVVRARYETDLGFRILGKITTRIVNVGDRVRTGDVIARLDPEDLKLQVASAEAELAAARSSLVQTTSDEQRYSTLRARGYATVADAERKQAAKEEAKAAWNALSARSTLRAINSAMPNSGPTLTALSRPRLPNPARL